MDKNDIGKNVDIKTQTGSIYNKKSGIITGIRNYGMFGGWVEVKFTPEFTYDKHTYTKDIFMPKELTIN